MSLSYFKPLNTFIKKQAKLLLFIFLFLLLIFFIPKSRSFIISGLPQFKGMGTYWLTVLNDVGIYASLAISLNLVLGQAGLFHMGHAAFFAIGAYTAAILNAHFALPLMWCLLPSGLVAGLVALILMRPIAHLQGDYFLVVTIGIVEIVRIALNNNILGLTGGANGLFGIPRPVIFSYTISSSTDFFFFIWGFTALTCLVFYFLAKSRFGRALNFIKEDPVAAEGIGINTSLYKLLGFTIGAFWAGVTGTIAAGKMSTISPDLATFQESVFLFVIVILGGSGSIKGVLLGSFLVIGLPELFGELKEYRMLFFGAALVGMMIFRPQGLLPPKPTHYKLPGDFSKRKVEFRS